MLIILFAFAAGFVTVLAPCILPVLPLILSGGAVQGRLRPWGIIAGVVLSFSLFTLSLSWAVQQLGLSANFSRNFGIAVLGLLGVFFLVPRAMELVEGWMSRRMSRASAPQQRHGFGGGFVLGVSLGAVWTPCAGPILAGVVAAAQTGDVSGQTVAVTIAYAIGAAIPMGLIAGLGQRVISRVRALSKHLGTIQKIFGMVLIAMALLMATNVDRKAQTWIIERTPNWLPQLQGFEENVDMKTGSMKNEDTTDTSSLKDYGEAPELKGITGWINSEPQTLAGLRGKVVLVKFWTYSCINCIRTMPYVQAWYDAYHDDGFEILAVHTPEFAFEKVPENVAQAVKDFKITYPVALDPDYDTWRAYDNQYWPAEYFIDADGHIRYVHFGEGAYDTAEQVIRALLKEAGRTIAQHIPADMTIPFREGQTPETYFGTKRAERFGSTEKLVAGTAAYSLNSNLDTHAWGLAGTWSVDNESALAGVGGTLEMRVKAKEMYVVMGSADTTAHPVTISIDGAGVSELEIAGAAGDQTLYRVAQFVEYGEHTVGLAFPDGGVHVYAATFSGETPTGLACGMDGKCDVIPVTKTE